MKEEIEKLLIKAENENQEALDAVIMLTNIYTYGLYREEKNSEKAKYWSNRAKELEQKLSKNPDISKNENIKTNKTFNNRFDNIQNNLKFVGTKDNIDEKYTNKKQRFDNIQNNLKFVDTESTADNK